MSKVLNYVVLLGFTLHLYIHEMFSTQGNGHIFTDLGDFCVRFSRRFKINLLLFYCLLGTFNTWLMELKEGISGLTGFKNCYSIILNNTIMEKSHLNIATGSSSFYLKVWLPRFFKLDPSHCCTYTSCLVILNFCK